MTTLLNTILSLAGVAVLAFTSPAQAQYVKGNEAVQVMLDGTRKVETPPTKGALLSAPCPAAKPGCAGSGWRMVETNDGLQECTEIHARPGTCQPSTYGKEKRTRLWIVKSKGQWLHCQFPDLSSKCVKTSALPFPAVQ